MTPPDAVIFNVAAHPNDGFTGQQKRCTIIREAFIYATAILLIEIITSGSLWLSHGLLKSVEVGRHKIQNLKTFYVLFSFLLLTRPGGKPILYKGQNPFALRSYIP